MVFGLAVVVVLGGFTLLNSGIYLVSVWRRMAYNQVQIRCSGANWEFPMGGFRFEALLLHMSSASPELVQAALLAIPSPPDPYAFPRLVLNCIRFRVST